MAALSLYLLLTWIFLLSLFRTRFAEVLCHADESFALMEFKRSFRTNTTDWRCIYPKVHSWSLDGSGDCCSWDGVECDEVTGRVITLNLSSSCLSGTMSPNTTLFRLVHMESLNLAFNSFNFSSIPYGFGNLSKLQYLNLSHSEFSGEIPRDISQLSKLVSLDLSTYWNETLRMPNMGGFVHNLTRLKELDLSSVSLLSPLPPILANFSSLTLLRLDSCGLSGNFPVSIFQLPNLKVLSVAYNFNLSGFFPKPYWDSPLKSLHLSLTNFSGEIPTSIGNLSLLNELKAWDCYFSGSLPSSMGNLSHLIELDLDRNNLQCQIPVSFANLNQLSELDLSYNNLSGDSLEWMVNLTKLTVLDISGNRLSGGFPSSFENLKQLTFLDLSSNDLHGDILGALRNLKDLQRLYLGSLNLNSVLDVNDLFTLKNLTTLYLSNNNISFTKSFINATALKLASLYLDSCNLTEFPRFIGYLSELKELYLRQNRLRENWLSSGFPSSLTYLDLSSNDLHGDILGALRNLKDLQRLYLRSLNLNGVLDVNDLFTLKNLRYLVLSNSNISFTKSFINATTSKLACLYLNSCNLTEVPRFIGYLSELKVLCLQYNKIRGNQLSNGFPSSLTYLDLSSNDLHGDILAALRNLKDLKELYLGSLNLNGVLDVDDLFTLKNLTILYLSDNNISFTKSFINATTSKLAYLYLDSCNLTEFPRFIGYLSELKVLRLQYNIIQGIIPRWMWNNSKESLKYVDLSHNLLTGFENNQTDLPLPNLRYFDVSSNLLETTLPFPPPLVMLYNISNNILFGDIPTSICERSSLTMLDFSNNALNGTLPPCLGSIGPLIFLNLARNKFDGMIPHVYHDDCQLRMIDLRENQLRGTVPKSLGNCGMLEFLNLGGNQINDTFPFWLSKLAYLKVIDLRSNNFYGPIEGHLNQLNFTSLHILDLSNNNFNGKLPSKLLQSCLAMKVIDGQENLAYMSIHQLIDFSVFAFDGSQMTYAMTLMNKGTERDYVKIPDTLAAIDLSNNKFEGFIPELIGDLKSLRMLNLSNNSLTGGIPPSLANLTVLESLDLSLNNLVGGIPQQLASLTFLAVFDVSHNRLSGPIPRGTQFDTFGSNSFVMNAGLCGSPLPNKCTNVDNAPLPPSFTVDNEEESLFDLDWKIMLAGAGVGFLVGVVLGNLIIDKNSRWFLRCSKRMAKGCNRCGYKVV